MGAEEDIGHLYSKVNTLSTKVAEIEAIQPFLKQMLERNTAVSEKLTNTLTNIQLSMEHLNDKMEQQARTLEEQKEEFTVTNRELNKRITQIDQKVDKLEDKGKFDIHMFLKSNWPWIVIILGLGINYVARFVKF